MNDKEKSKPVPPKAAPKPVAPKPAQKEPIAEITVRDLEVVLGIFNAAANAGLIKAADMSTVGTTFDKLKVITQQYR